MNKQIAKKGDLVLVAPWARQNRGKRRKSRSGCNDGHRNVILTALTDPELTPDIINWEPGSIITMVACPNGCKGWTYTSNLIPIRDPDAGQQITTERDTPREFA